MHRTLLTTMSLIAGLLVAAATAAPAHADRELGKPAQPNQITTSTTHLAPAAPTNVERFAGAAAVSPTTYPSAPTTYVPANSGYDCAPGNLCTLVWDPTRNLFKQFSFLRCNRYYVYNWIADGFTTNHQWGATATFYGQGGTGDVLGTIPANNQNYAREWYPVWSLRNC
jgi:hypothetical protein